MGKMALLLILGLSVTAGIVAYTINTSREDLVTNVSGFDKYTNARNIAHTCVNMILRRLDRNDTSLVNPLQLGGVARLESNVMDGDCSVEVKVASLANLDTIDVVSKSRFMDTIYTMKLRLQRSPFPFPEIGQAVGLNVPDLEFEFKGNASLIDGRDHDINGNLTSGSNDKPAVGVLNPDDTLKVLDSRWSDQIIGNPKVVVDSSMADPFQYVDEYIAAADVKYTGKATISGNQTWGSPTAPWIIYCDATVGELKFTGTIEGWGILVCRGGIELEGRVSFHGLVIAFDSIRVKKKKDPEFEVELEGTPVVIGGILMSGPKGEFELEGNSEIYYSKEALDMARYINKLQAYKVTRWYE